jgi:hypothetical protein
MKKSIWAAAAGVLALGLVACSGGSNSVVGTWVVDVDKTVDPIVDQAMAMVKKSLEAIPSEQRKMAEGHMPTREKMKEEMSKEMADGVLEVKSDGTFTMKGEKKADSTTGTWVEKDGAVTFTPKTHNGQPAEGEKAKPMTAGWDGSQLYLRMDAPAGAEQAGITELKIYFKKK